MVGTSLATPLCTPRRAYLPLVPWDISVADRCAHLQPVPHALFRTTPTPSARELIPTVGMSAASRPRPHMRAPLRAWASPACGDDHAGCARGSLHAGRLPFCLLCSGGRENARCLSRTWAVLQRRIFHSWHFLCCTACSPIHLLWIVFCHIWFLHHADAMPTSPLPGAFAACWTSGHSLQP